MQEVSFCSCSSFTWFIFPINEWVSALVRSGWFAHCWWWGASQWLFLPTCSPTEKRTISSRSLDVPPSCLHLSYCQQGRSHPQVILSTSWSTIRAAVFGCPKGDISNSKELCLSSCRSQRPSFVPRQGEFCLNYLTYMYQTKAFPLTLGDLLWIFTILTVKNPFSCLL